MIGMHECLRCENFISGERSPYTWKCRAFPDGIPYERFSNINESNRDYCNNGIGFVPQKEETESEKHYKTHLVQLCLYRSGTNGEDLYFYNTRTKKWYSSTTGTQAGTLDYTEEIRRALQESEKDEIVSFHNHPLGMPPSDGDLNAALKNGYQKGYTIGHDGTVFEYTAPKEFIPPSMYDAKRAKYTKKVVRNLKYN